MINGQMTEARDGVALLEDVDRGTFERFLQWAYAGYYTAADPETALSSLSIPSSPNKDEPALNEFPLDEPQLDVPQDESVEIPDLPMPETTDWNWGTAQRGKSSKKGKTSHELKEFFLRREYTVRQETFSIPPGRANQSANEDYTEVFLSHARLYVFAEKYDIQRLKILALEELHNTLAIFTLHRGRTGDIVTLLKYVYANTSTSARSGESLRLLLRDYIGYEMSTLMTDEDFRDLMVHDGGPLLGDFLKMVAIRIK